MRLTVEDSLVLGDEFSHAVAPRDREGWIPGRTAGVDAFRGPVIQRYLPTQEASMAGQTAPDAEQLIERIRKSNEQIIEAGRKAGLDFLQAYEQTLNAFAEYQEKLADSSQLEGLTSVLRAQADFTRQVVGAYSEAARTALKD